jgi:hypothetical protein
VPEQSPTWQSYVSHIRETAERSSDELVRAELLQLAKLYERLRRIVGRTALEPSDDAPREPEPPPEADAAAILPKRSSVEAGSLLAYLVLMNQRR